MKTMSLKKATKDTSEFKEQCIIFEWAKLQQKMYPCLEFMFSTLNGVNLTMGQAKKAKLSGNKSGVPDIILTYPNKKYHGLFIELKVGYNNPSLNQKKYINFLNQHGYYCQVCIGSRDGIETIRKYLKNEL